jgi:hypothetical protein
MFIFPWPKRAPHVPKVITNAVGRCNAISVALRKRLRYGVVMATKQIEVRAAKTQQAVLDGECDVVLHCETIKEAKRLAKHLLTDEEMRAIEASEPNTYSQVCVDGECLYDYFRK